MPVNADGATLSYNLYTSNSYTTVIDAENTLDGTGAGPSTAVTKTVYGKAPGGQDVAPGDYSDTITVTVSY
jgi:spore coat protein U-like protein